MTKEEKHRKDMKELNKWAKENPNESAISYLFVVLVLPVIVIFALFALPFMLPLILIAALCGISLSFFPFPPI